MATLSSPEGIVMESFIVEERKKERKFPLSLPSGLVSIAYWAVATKWCLRDKKFSERFPWRLSRDIFLFSF
jgi:hypothetical protein